MGKYRWGRKTDWKEMRGINFLWRGYSRGGGDESSKIESLRIK